MKYDDFKKHKIHKRKGLQLEAYSKYRPFLSEDFEERCCYCNICERTITTPFHVEHFIPEKEFTGKKDSLLTDYRNLMWACPKCNLSKGSKYAGDLMNCDEIENELFYNPEKIDYNTIFFRNELGAIDSDDPKGKQMIRLLKLYHPIHTLAWLIEKLSDTYDLLEKAIELETDPDKRKDLEEKKDKIANIYVKKERIFKVAYRTKFH